MSVALPRGDKEFEKKNTFKEVVHGGQHGTNPLKL